jgi:hypothetical protein
LNARAGFCDRRPGLDHRSDHPERRRRVRDRALVKLRLLNASAGQFPVRAHFENARHFRGTLGEFAQPRRQQLSAAVSRAAAVHESEIGTSRHLPARQYFGRFRGEADMNPFYEYAP